MKISRNILKSFFKKYHIYTLLHATNHVNSFVSESQLSQDSLVGVRISEDL